MPRSGTTLVEQILSSHSQTSSISESNFLPDKILPNIYNKNKDKILNFISSNLHENYTEFLGSFNINNKIVIDKTLQNFWYVGFIFIFFQTQKLYMFIEIRKITVYQFSKIYLICQRDGVTSKMS